MVIVDGVDKRTHPKRLRAGSPEGLRNASVIGHASVIGSPEGLRNKVILWRAGKRPA